MAHEDRFGALWILPLVLSIFILLWQFVASCYWWPYVSSLIENTASASDFEEAGVPQFKRLAIFLPAFLQLGFAGLGMVALGLDAGRRPVRARSVALLACGLGGVALAIYAILKAIADLA